MDNMTKRMLGTSFPLKNGNTATVVGVFSKNSKGEKNYAVSCSGCSHDKELYKDRPIVARRDKLLKGSLGCICSGNYRYNEYQIDLLMHRYCQQNGLELMQRSGDFNRLRTEYLIRDGDTFKTLSLKSIKLRKGVRKPPKCLNNKNRDITLKFPRKTLEPVLIKYLGSLEGAFVSWEDGRERGKKSKFTWVCAVGHECTSSYTNMMIQESGCKYCHYGKKIGVSGCFGFYPERSKDVDYLYVISFSGEYLKVGRSFDVQRRIKQLKTSSGMDNLKLLKVLVDCVVLSLYCS